MAVKLSKEFKVGLFALIAGLALFTGLNFLKGSDFLSSNNTYFVVYENVAGLVVSNTVQFNGLVVGRVKKLSVVSNSDFRILAELEIDKNLPVSAGSKALLASPDLLGGKAIYLEMGPAGGKVMVDDDTLAAGVVPGLMEDISAKAMPMLANLDSISAELKVVARSFKGTIATLDKTLSSFEKTSNSVNGLIVKTEPQVASIMNNARVLTGNLVETERSLQQMMGKLNRFGDTLNKVKVAATVANLNKSIEGVNKLMADINAGKGSMGKLVKNDSLYRNLNNSSASLDALLKDFKASPKRYVHFSIFGKKAEKDAK